MLMWFQKAVKEIEYFLDFIEGHGVEPFTLQTGSRPDGSIRFQVVVGWICYPPVILLFLVKQLSKKFSTVALVSLMIFSV